MRASVRAMLPALVLVACAPAAAPVPPERARRDTAILRLVEPCQRRFPGVSASLDEAGRLQAQAPPGRAAELNAFRQCVVAEARRALNVTDAPLGAGRVRAGFSRATVPIRIVGNGLVVSASVNGTPANLLLDTGASYSILSPGLARRAGITPGPGTPRVMGSVVGGRMFVMPYVRLRALGVGNALVEEIEVGVFDALPHASAIDGLLGANFLGHFRVTIDREGRSLVLEPSRGGT